jgi:glycosyltransferase involved in cell wall biosynthesis
MVDHGRTGLLFDPEDERALSSLLLGVITDAGHARRLAEAGRREVEAKYSLQRMAEAYQHHYLDLLDVRGRVASRRSSNSSRSAYGTP